MKKRALISTALAFGLLTPLYPATTTSAQDVVNLRIMGTTDTHMNLLNYDYFKGTTAPKVGLVTTATLIQQARNEVKNSVLVDSGDTIQGTPLGTYMAKVNTLKKGQVHPIISLMNAMDYDMATLGNHEFNYGLDFLEETYNDADFGIVSANVYIDDHDTNPDNDVNMYTPYEIQEKTVIAEDGTEHTLKIGYLGLVAPQIVNWDKVHLEGKVITKDIVATAEKFVPEMKEKGADIIIALAHSGFDGNAEAYKGYEDAIYPLSKVDGIDAINFSHTHKVFPTENISSLDNLFKISTDELYPGIDNEKGTINGVPATQAGYGGENLGIIDLTLTKENNKWTVVDGKSTTKQIYDAETESATVEADAELVKLIQADHEATVSYTLSKIGTTTTPIHSYFALVQDDPSIQIVTAAQKWYAEKYIQLNSPEYKDTPILSVGAPFKSGRNGIEDYTEITIGDVTIRSASDLYLYDNTLKGILSTGAGVKEWLEMSAGKFNTIDPNSTEEQALLNPNFQGYSYDVIDGVTYQIDVTKSPKYHTNGTVNDASSSRIVNLQYNGKPIDPEQEFIILTNNHRANGGSNFPGVKGSKVVVDSADESRQILMDYITEIGEVNPTIDNNWSIAPINENVKITFTSSPKAEQYAKLTDNITFTGKTDDKGFGIFTLDLSQQNTPTFQDVTEDYWAKTYIDNLAAQGIISGTSEENFGPDEMITRGQFLAMLVRTLGLSDGTLTVGEEIQLAYNNGLTAQSPTHFAANDAISREQIAAMMINAYEWKIGDVYEAKASAPYKDKQLISPRFISQVDAAYELQLLTGYENGQFQPQNTATRAQATRVIYSFLQN